MRVHALVVCLGVVLPNVASARTQRVCFREEGNGVTRIWAGNSNPTDVAFSLRDILARNNQNGLGGILIDSTFNYQFTGLIRANELPSDTHCFRLSGPLASETWYVVATVSVPAGSHTISFNG